MIQQMLQTMVVDRRVKPILNFDQMTFWNRDEMNMCMRHVAQFSNEWRNLSSQPKPNQYEKLRVKIALWHLLNFQNYDGIKTTQEN